MLAAAIEAVPFFAVVAAAAVPGHGLEPRSSPRHASTAAISPHEAPETMLTGSGGSLGPVTSVADLGESFPYVWVPVSLEAGKNGASNKAVVQVLCDGEACGGRKLTPRHVVSDAHGAVQLKDEVLPGGARRGRVGHLVVIKEVSDGHRAEAARSRHHGLREAVDQVAAHE